MHSIGKIIKKYFFVIILVITLIAIQANCELALPSYTSNIVNVGIQQSGIEKAIPEYLSVTIYNKIKAFLTTDNKNLMEQNYLLTAKGDLKEDYYKLKEIDEKTEEDLEKALIQPLAIIYYLENGAIDVKTLGFSSLSEMYSALSYLDDATKTKMLNEKIGEEESLLKQVSLNMIKMEYDALGVNVNNMQMDYIITTGLKMLAIALLAAIVTIVASFFSSRIGAFFARDLRKKIAEQVMTYSHKEFEEISTASLITRTTNDVTQIQNLLVMSLRMLVFAPIMGIGAIIKVHGNSLSWIIVSIVLLIILLVIVVFSFVTPKFKIVQKLIDKLNLISREFITGIPVIRAFSNEKYEEKKFDEANTNLMRLSLFLNKITSVLMPLMNLIMNVACILIIWYGAKRIDFGTLQVGDLIAFITYTIHIIMSFLVLSMFSIMLPRGIVSLKRIAEVLNKESVIQEKKQTIPFVKDLKGTIEFKNVFFRYADAKENVLENISFKVEAGSTVAFIGSTGSGKSTLINLIPRFSDVTYGEILVDGVNIKDASLSDLRARIGYVPQKGILFSGTIKSNIALGVKKISQEDLEMAMDISCAKEFIKTKEKGVDSPISQGGTNVSGGQRQRLAIARAIAKKPEIYIFDDSFSALDYKTDARVRKLLNKHTKGSTKLIVAQRVSTIMNADKIIVLDEGKIVDMGTHDELLKTCKIYQEIAHSQLKEVA